MDAGEVSFEEGLGVNLFVLAGGIGGRGLSGSGVVMIWEWC